MLLHMHESNVDFSGFFFNVLFIILASSTCSSHTLAVDTRVLYQAHGQYFSVCGYMIKCPLVTIFAPCHFEPLSIVLACSFFLFEFVRAVGQWGSRVDPLAMLG